MIAEKLLGCCSSQVHPQGTVFLAFAQSPAGGAPEAIIGQLRPGHAGIALNGAGGAIVQSAGRAIYDPLPAESFGAGDFLLDIAFDGENVPSVVTLDSFSCQHMPAVRMYQRVALRGVTSSLSLRRQAKITLPLAARPAWCRPG